VHVIAEAGVNHNGDLDLAYQLVNAAAASGANAVKFQMFNAASLVTSTGAKAPYQIDRTSGSGTQIEMLRALELRPHHFDSLAAHARNRGVEFLCTPFDEASLHYLTDHLGVTTLKIGSGDLTNGPLLLAAAKKNVRIILSCGMATLLDVAKALSVLAHGFAGRHGPPSIATQEMLSVEDVVYLKERVVLLQCTTAYPAPFEEVNLSAITTLRNQFGLPVGLSDHSTGSSVSIAAVAFGAVILEKHLTLSRGLPGPDHAASLEPQDFSSLVTSIRQAEKAIGDGIKRPSASEVENSKAARRSVVATKLIRRGEPFTPSNIAVKRPGNGLSPMLYWECLTKVAPRDFTADELIEL
jgi:N-acetylneuraminate synthase